MSVLDDLRGLEQRVTDRMRELRPLVDEYRELEQVAERLGINGNRGPEPATPVATQPPPARHGRRRATAKTATGQATPATGSRGGRTKPARKRRRGAVAAPGARRQQVLEAVSKRPGISVREIGVQLGVDPTSLYRSVRDLENDGSIEKRGKELHPR